MAVHVPKGQSYHARLRAWASGICPFCPSTDVTEERTPTSRIFRCGKCKAENKFSLPRILEEKP